MTNWNLDRHILGKVYSLTQKNMNAMIADIQLLKIKNFMLKGKNEMLKEKAMFNCPDCGAEYLRYEASVKMEEMQKELEALKELLGE